MFAAKMFARLVLSSFVLVSALAQASQEAKVVLIEGVTVSPSDSVTSDSVPSDKNASLKVTGRVLKATNECEASEVRAELRKTTQIDGTVVLTPVLVQSPSSNPCFHENFKLIYDDISAVVSVDQFKSSKVKIQAYTQENLEVAVCEIAKLCNIPSN